MSWTSGAFSFMGTWAVYNTLDNSAHYVRRSFNFHIEMSDPKTDIRESIKEPDDTSS
jgi:hypothetical protein